MCTLSDAYILLNGLKHVQLNLAYNHAADKNNK